MTRPNTITPERSTETHVALYKPYGVLSQFTPDGSPNRPLSALGLPKGVWPVGRLDADSEGLLLLSSSKTLPARLLTPGKGHPRTYYVEVEGEPTSSALDALASGVVVQGRLTLPAEAARLDAVPNLPPRNPPIRFRKSVPTSWISLTLWEGRNRQVRRMTAAVGFPTLRLVRVAIGPVTLGDLLPGAFRPLTLAELGALMGRPGGLHA